ncbi:uncharacterized protein BO66DRAFT_434818 [Aspergillus aculeatinus CBS 121060]|uniref:Uncharacterized protein n=1 Tax=Aspergillus aculeatinus CBS 121060 TaxID=1448322 RepID=A0ACD1HJR7_9EURO|nr:hypothetical protein BO66DRAFT_434818 [Aspergillus aculeatinus CBS 121060]RAH73826.1 hypothetical protein BO66DRAFT_434818 [Aspergillus aculeatinus CBS 121060]
MVWIYGAGDSFGQIYDSAYNLTGLVTGADQKGFAIIYVAMNYCVGIFGLAASPALAASDFLSCWASDWSSTGCRSTSPGSAATRPKSPLSARATAQPESVFRSRHTAVVQRKHPSIAQMTAWHASVPSTATYLFALNQTVFRSWYVAANSSYIGVSHFSDIPYVFNQAQSDTPPFGSPSRGNGTIAAWTGFTNAAFSSSARPHHESSRTEQYLIQIIGGPDSGVREIGQNVIRGGYEDLAARCAFWTSREVVEALMWPVFYEVDVHRLPLHQGVQDPTEPLDCTTVYRQLPCEHSFHQPCIDAWLCNHDTSCPLCRAQSYHLRRRIQPAHPAVQQQVLPPTPRPASFRSWCKRAFKRAGAAEQPPGIAPPLM